MSLQDIRIYLILILVCIYIVYCYYIYTLKDKSNDKIKKHEDYPSGLELVKQLKGINIYGIDTWKLDYTKIDTLIFKDIVYKYEFLSGYSREISLEKGLKEYMRNHNIKI